MEFETPTAVQDVAADHRNASAPLHREGVASMMCMPLQVGASTIGVLCALSSRRRRFTVGEMELLYTIANQAAVAIENARMYADVRHKSLELRKSFQRVARALGSSQFPHALPDLIASLTQDLTQADRCALFTVEINGSLTMESSVGYRVAAPPPGNVAETPTAWVARKGRSLAIADIEADPRFGPAIPRPIRGRAGAYLAVPLRTGNRVVIGVLEVYTRTPRRWRAGEVRVLIAFAAQAAVAFQNARLVEEGSRAGRRADALSALLRLAVAPTPPTVDAVVSALDGGTESAYATVVLRRKDCGAAWDTAYCGAAAADFRDAALHLADTDDPEADSGAGVGVTSASGTSFIYRRAEPDAPTDPGDLTAKSAVDPSAINEADICLLRAAVELIARAE